MLINLYIYNLLISIIFFNFFNFSICNWLRLGISNYDLPSLEFINNFNHRERHTIKKMKIIEQKSSNNQQENKQLNITNIFYNDFTKSDLIERKKFNSLLNEFSYSQLNFIKQNLNSLKVIRSGVKIAIEQCAIEFDKERWNCSIEDNKEVFGQTLKRANRETAFIQSIISAGITYSITKACSTGNLKNCACDYKYERYSDILKEEENNKKRSWHWAGCSDNLKYGIQLSKQFLDSTEIEDLKKKPSLRLTMSLHNHKAGREAIKKLMRLKCRCHGSSGSCQLKTCWRILPNFDEIGKYLKKKYQKSLQIEALIKGVDIKRNKRSKELKNPNFKINYHSINKDQILSQDQNTFNLMGSLNNPSFFLNKIGYKDENSFFFNDLNEGNENLNKLDSTKVLKKQLSKKVFKSSKKINDFWKNSFLNQTNKTNQNKNEITTKDIKYDLNDNISKPNKLDLVYIHKSPNYCNQNLDFKILGTIGRSCNKNGKKSDNCESLCCGRGYLRKIVHKIETCQCKFEWCCEVKCKTCEIITENYTCK